MKPKSNIPEARRLLKIALQSAETTGDFRYYAEAALRFMTRASPAKKRAPVKSAIVDAWTAERIRQLVTTYPALSIVEVAEQFGTNPGRVSEALHYLR